MVIELLFFTRTHVVSVWIRVKQLPYASYELKYYENSLNPNIRDIQ